MRFIRSLLIALTALLAGCGACGSNEEAIASARSLSQPRLAQLFRDLAPQSIAIDGHIARVHLSGCADDKALLIATGLDRRGREEITLRPGEAKDALMLWRAE